MAMMPIPGNPNTAKLAPESYVNNLDAFSAKASSQGVNRSNYATALATLANFQSSRSECTHCVGDSYKKGEGYLHNAGHLRLSGATVIHSTGLRWPSTLNSSDEVALQLANARHTAMEFSRELRTQIQGGSVVFALGMDLDVQNETLKAIADWVEGMVHFLDETAQGFGDKEIPQDGEGPANDNKRSLAMYHLFNKTTENASTVGGKILSPSQGHTIADGKRNEILLAREENKKNLAAKEKRKAAQQKAKQLLEVQKKKEAEKAEAKQKKLDLSKAKEAVKNLQSLETGVQKLINEAEKANATAVAANNGSSAVYSEAEVTDLQTNLQTIQDKLATARETLYRLENSEMLFNDDIF